MEHTLNMEQFEFSAFIFRLNPGIAIIVIFLGGACHYVFIIRLLFCLAVVDALPATFSVITIVWETGDVDFMLFYL